MKNLRLVAAIGAAVLATAGGIVGLGLAAVATTGAITGYGGGQAAWDFTRVIARYAG